MATAKSSQNTMDFKGMALQAEQLKDNSGNAANISDIVAKNDNSSRFVAGGSTKVLTAATANGKVVKLDTATGTTVTLPAATGSGITVRALVTVLATSNQHKVQVANSSDHIIGIICGHRVDTGNAMLAFTAGATDDTVTLNRTTTGSVSLGEWLDFEDVATNIWSVKGELSATGAAFATPFSSAV